MLSFVVGGVMLTLASVRVGKRECEPSTRRGSVSGRVMEFKPSESCSAQRRIDEYANGALYLKRYCG